MVWIGLLGDQLHADRRRQVIDFVDVGHQPADQLLVGHGALGVAEAGDGSMTAARLSIEPVDSSSTTDTRSPRASSASIRWLPMNPAPPVTRQCFMENDE